MVREDVVVVVGSNLAFFKFDHFVNKVVILHFTDFVFFCCEHGVCVVLSEVNEVALLTLEILIWGLAMLSLMRFNCFIQVIRLPALVLPLQSSVFLKGVENL